MLSTNRLNEGIDASLDISGKSLFIRCEKHLYAIEQYIADPFAIVFFGNFIFL